MKNKGKKWTVEEERVITDQVRRNANNIKKGLENASRLLERPYPACNYHYYAVMLKRPSMDTCFVTIGKTSKNINRKVVTDRTSDNTDKVKVKWWNKLLKFLKE